MKEIEIKDSLETIYYDECDNGLKIFMWPKKDVRSFYITLSVKYGSNHTKFKINGKNKIYEVPCGTAHYLEHINFNESDGTTAHDYFAKLGSYVNAFTTFEYTTYQVYASNNFKENLNHLIDYVTTPYITKKLVDKERGIILEEANMGHDNPYQELQFSFFKNILKNMNYRNLVIGENDEIKKITAKDLQLVFDTFYHPKNMFIVITGNFNPYEASAMIKENQKNKTYTQYKEPEIVSEKEPISVVKPYQLLEKDIGEAKVKIGLKFNKSKFKVTNDLKLKLILSTILNINFGLTSDFRNELLEKELITAMDTSVFCKNNIVILQVTCQTKYSEEVTKLIKEKLNNLSVTEKEFNRNIKANIANLILDYDDIELVNDNISYSLIDNGKIITNYKEIYKSIKLNEIERVINSIDLKNISVVNMIPNK